jgi:superfamily II DNA or RNA helicase
MPGARVGRIQGPTIDIENKDIVIAMLQSLSMKHYDLNLFDCFGFTIIDEVHHMGAEVFSQALQKVITPYVLGLSATMNRKDGLTKVFKMFMGDIVHTEKRDTTSAVVNVRIYEYKNKDDEFSEMKYDYRGNPLYSTMIKKLCDCDDRSEFLLDIVESNLKEYPELQLMVLAHNKSLLKYLYEGSVKRNIADGSIGYYLGGMKSEKLKESEGKQLILATYAMASEGLDIKTLGALVMATPKSDIVQTAGRILRTTDGRKLIVDVVDQHDIFQNQHTKRKTFYRKQKYLMNKVGVADFRKAINNGVEVEWESVKTRKEKSVFDDCLL